MVYGRWKIGANLAGKLKVDCSQNKNAMQLLNQFWTWDAAQQTWKWFTEISGNRNQQENLDFSMSSNQPLEANLDPDIRK